MLESKKEMVALESSLSSSSTKRSPFHLLSSIFSKKKQSILENEAVDKAATQSGAHHLNKLVNDFSDSENLSTAPSYSNDPDFWGNPMEFESPILKTRRKNLRLDLETLHQSRQDNPYLKQLECFTGSKEALLSFSLAEKAQAEWRESDVDIHQHLVRSPPPQFPQNLSHFMYSQANSPKRHPTKTESCENVEPGGIKKSKPLNPVQSKWEIGMLDPGIREVLEYQKSQLRAGLNESFYGSRAKLGTAPTHYTLSDRFTSFDSRDTLLHDNCSRPSRPAGTLSLPSYLDLEQTLKKIPLGPLRIGRTLSDSICHDNKFKNKTLRH